MQTTIVIKQVYQLLKEAVINMKGDACRTINTFAVLQTMQELSADNLGKFICDKNQPYFYSRLWVDLGLTISELRFNWPALVVFENNFENKELFSNQQEKCYNLQLSVLDQHKQNLIKSNCEGCEGRVINQIYDDTEFMLDNVIQYVRNSTYISNGTVGRLVNKTHLTYLQTNNLIPGFTEDVTVGKSFANDIKRDNPVINGFRREGDTNSILYGTVYNIKVCLNSCKVYTPVINPKTPIEYLDSCC